jgi:Uma2 family endonuclease
MSAITVPAPVPTLAPPTTAPPPSTSATFSGGGRPRRWTRDEYYRLIDLGLFRPDERLELLDGEILEKVTENPSHVAGLDLTLRQLHQATAGRNCYIRVQHPISLPDAESDPEPDLAVVSGTPRSYETRHPQFDKILLLAEISNTMLEYDQGARLSLTPQQASASIG